MKRAALSTRVRTLDQHPQIQVYDLRHSGPAAWPRDREGIHRQDQRHQGAALVWMRCCADARRGRFDVVLVWASRSAGPVSVRHFLEVLDELNRLNIEFVSASANNWTPAAHWAAPSWSLLASSPSWNAA